MDTWPSLMRGAQKISAAEIYNCGNIKVISVLFHSLSLLAFCSSAVSVILAKELMGCSSGNDEAPHASYETVSSINTRFESMYDLLSGIFGI